MELTVLGSGTAVPHPRRSSAAFWLKASSGTVLLDLAAPAPLRMAQEDLEWAGLDAIWISHFHMDHCAGLAPLLFGLRNAPETRKRTKPLTIFGAGGLRELLAQFDTAADHKLLTLRFPVQIVEIEPLEPFEILPGVEAVACPTPHTDDSHAIHIRDRETTLVYTSDTGFDERLATFARRVDLFLLECSFFRDKPIQKHLELAEAVWLIRKAEPRRAMLTHFYSDWDEVNFEEEIEKLSTGLEVIQAFDGLRMDLSDKLKTEK